MTLIFSDPHPIAFCKNSHTHKHRGSSIRSQRHWPEKGLRHRLLWRTTAASSWHSNGPGKPFPEKGGCLRGEVSPPFGEIWRGKKEGISKGGGQRLVPLASLQEEKSPEAGLIWRQRIEDVTMEESEPLVRKAFSLWAKHSRRPPHSCRLI